MSKLRYLIISILLVFCVSPVYSQTIEGLRDIVSFQQEKISRIEDNLKKLVGLIEEQSNLNNENNNLKSIENQINNINDKLRLFENNIKNITNLTYDLDFALKRVERHLQLSSIKSDNDRSKENTDNTDYKIEKKADVNKKSLDPKTNGVLGFVKETDSKVNQSNDTTIDQTTKEDKKVRLLPQGTADENYNYALDLASQLDFINAEKAFKEFLITHKESSKIADAQYWLGRVYFAQKKFEEAAIALAEFNSVFPNDPRFQETTLLIAEAAVNFAPKSQLCDILNQSLEFMINPSEKFIKRINFLKNEKQCSAE
jgi:TolA-binding protein